MTSLLGNDAVALYLQAIRKQLGDRPEWSELEPIIYDTLKDYEQLPQATLNIAGLDKLTEQERQEFVKQLSEYIANYGLECRRDLLTELVSARVRIWYLERK